MHGCKRENAVLDICWTYLWIQSKKEEYFGKVIFLHGIEDKYCTCALYATFLCYIKWSLKNNLFLVKGFKMVLSQLPLGRPSKQETITFICWLFIGLSLLKRLHPRRLPNIGTLPLVFFGIDPTYYIVIDGMHSPSYQNSVFFLIAREDQFYLSACHWQTNMSYQWLL